jgi:hypothetical protein
LNSCSKQFAQTYSIKYLEKEKESVNKANETYCVFAQTHGCACGLCCNIIYIMISNTYLETGNWLEIHRNDSSTSLSMYRFSFGTHGSNAIFFRTRA